MAGYVIHLAIAEEYIKKHNKEKNNYDEFINGVIFPDSVKDKSETHYGAESSESNLYDFLMDKKLDTAFNRGYFLHLLTDYLFYNHYLGHVSNDIYNDYDVLNDFLIEKYNVVLPEDVKKVVHSTNGELKILSIEVVERLIEEISELDIDRVAEETIENPVKWTKIKRKK